MNRSFQMMVRKLIKDVGECKYLDYVKTIKDPDMDSKILVQIPSFCDTELLRTLQSFIASAANPERVHFVICYQDNDLDTLKILNSMKRVKVIHFMEKDAPGLCAARYLCNKAVTNEKYICHLDSHMRAAKFWDVVCIAQWKECHDDKAIITEHVADYSKYYDLDINDPIFTTKMDTHVSVINAYKYCDDNAITPSLMCRTIDGEAKTPRRGAFIGGGFVFAKAELDIEVPSDPQMFFKGDELPMALRYYTHGYNVYHPNIKTIWHLYHRQETIEKDNTKKLKRFTDNIGPKQATERKRMLKLYGMEDNEEDMTGFGLGDKRSLIDFQNYSGICFKTKTLLKFTTKGYYDIVHNVEDLYPVVANGKSLI